MKPSQNLILKASAGTGKTFSLTTRIIQLLSQQTLQGGPAVSPANILALTFSRAAAYEIYAKLVGRLAASAKDENAAKATNAFLSSSALSAKDYCQLLRRVIAVQHVDNIATLDSFILRMIQYFPLEFGFLGGVEIMDTYEYDQAILQAAETSLSSEESQHLEELFKALDNGMSRRQFQSRLVEMVQIYQDVLRSHPKILQCTTQQVCETLGIDARVRYQPVCVLEQALAKHPEWSLERSIQGIQGFIDHIRAWTTSQIKDILPKSGEAKNFVEAILADPINANLYLFGRGKSRERFFSTKVREAALADLKHLFHCILHDSVHQQLYTLKLVHAIDVAYHNQTRKRGRLTFSDLPWVLYERSQQTNLLQSLEYHFDTTFEHWALDEFQDTSLAQWACLQNLVLNAADDQEGRTVTIVGDLKQAIYAWRGGDERLFRHLMRCPQFQLPYGDVRNLSTSYRYEKHTCDFINRLFGPTSMQTLQETICQSLPSHIKDSPTPILSQWLDETCWMVHEPVIKEGRPLANDMVRVLEVQKFDKDVHSVDPLYACLGDEIEHLWALRQPLEAEGKIPQETVAVLVMKNDQGEAIADYLRSRKLPAVWEGESTLTDLPTIQYLIALLQFIEHPDDPLAWAMFTYTPLRAILFPTCTTPQEILHSAAQQLSAYGLTRTLMEWVKICCEETNGLDELSKQRLSELVAAATTFEQRSTAAQTLEDFLQFLDKQTFRDSAKNPSVIRVLTIHRSKGLGFDHVFLPIQEHQGLLAVRQGPYMYSQEADDTIPWAIASIKKEVLSFYPKLARAYERRLDESILATIHNYYVAMTRSMRTLTVCIQKRHKEDAKKSSSLETLYFSTFMKEIISQYDTPKEFDNYTCLYQAGYEPTTMKATAPLTPQLFSPHFETPPQANIQRLLPSRGLPADTPISDFFGKHYGKAAQRGNELHDQYAKIRWIDPIAPKNKFEADILASPLKVAFLKPEGPVELWVEEGYERMNGHRWETGRFDRVVIQGTGAQRYATIYDIKSNRRRQDQSLEAFYAHMQATYIPQMQAYRAALSALLGISPSAIQTTLLLLDTQTLLTI